MRQVFAHVDRIVANLKKEVTDGRHVIACRTAVKARAEDFGAS